MGVLVIRALLLGVYIKGSWFFWQLSFGLHQCPLYCRLRDSKGALVWNYKHAPMYRCQGPYGLVVSVRCLGYLQRQLGVLVVC